MITMPTRREFFLSCSAFAAATALVPAPVLAAPAPLGLREAGLNSITAEAFAEQLNTRFVVRNRGGDTVALLLAAVEPAAAGAQLLSPAATALHEQFSLFFAGADSRPLSQDTYTFEHMSLGRFAMFIVPVGRPVSGCRVYEAVFDRPTPSARGHKRDASGYPMR